ncbi:hypothetical protein [Bacillus sp. JJ675]|uniref:hypothetical protein n=1 Tax=Bacillus sp. JJ675 TaxID=3122972 RepID=UPI000B06B0A0
MLSGWMLIPPKAGVLKDIPPIPSFDWITKHKLSAKPGQAFQGSSSSVDAIVSCLVTGKTEDELKTRIHQLAKWFDDKIVWEKSG